MKHIYISAIYTSPPDTMGGNTKILIEIINNLHTQYDFTIFTTQPETFYNNVINKSNVKIVYIPYDYTFKNYWTHMSEVRYITEYYKSYFSQNSIKNDDLFYSASDFAPDVLPIYELKKRFSFIWIASLYLFIPSPIENITHKYEFPFVKYVIYFIYQKWIFSRILRKFDYCCITNDADKKYFPAQRRGDLFAFYGGVNVEQIAEANKIDKVIKYSAVFCSRLHPQKGISQLLDIWKEVTRKIPDAILAVIGNGDPAFEHILKEKANKLRLQNNISWLGYVNNIDKFGIYLQSKIFVHPTIYDNNGMVAAEALCTGLPVVTYDLEPLRKIYTDGCIKIEYGNKQAYANMLIKLLSVSAFYESTKPSFKTLKQLHLFWNWHNRAELFKTFLDRGDRH